MVKRVKFFKKKMTIEITDVYDTLIYRLKIILEIMSIGYEIDINKFEYCALETAYLHICLCSWHSIKPTMHKILVHY